MFVHKLFQKYVLVGRRSENALEKWREMRRGKIEMRILRIMQSAADSFGHT